MDPTTITVEFSTIAIVSVAALLALRQIQSAREALSDDLLKRALSWLAAATLTTYLFVVVRAFVLVAVGMGAVDPAATELIENYVLPSFVLLVFASVYFTARSMWEVGQTFGRFKEVGEDLSARMTQRQAKALSPPKLNEEN